MGEQMRKGVEVVAALIIDQGRLLATQRSYGQFQGGWEFPGGKPEAGETCEQALCREIYEELGTDLVIESLLQTVDYDYPDFHLTMHCYVCHAEVGKIELKEHQAARWLNAQELESVEWLPADWGVLTAIKAVLQKASVSH